MSTQRPSLLALEQAAAAEGRAYGRERLRERLQQIAEQQGSISPSSGVTYTSPMRPLPAGSSRLPNSGERG